MLLILVGIMPILCFLYELQIAVMTFKYDMTERLCALHCTEEVPTAML